MMSKVPLYYYLTHKEELKMKRIFSTFLAILLCFSCTSGVMAAPSDTTLHFNLTSDNLNEITVPTGTEITVKLSIENSTADTGFNIQSFSDVLEFDKDFFELDTDSFVFEESVKGVSPIIQLKYSSGDIPYIQVNDRYNPPKAFLSKQLVASFKMTVKATSGTGYVKHVDMTAKTSDGVYSESFANLKVTVSGSSSGGSTGGGSTGGGSTGGGSTGGGSTGGGSTGGGSTGGGSTGDSGSGETDPGDTGSGDTGTDNKPVGGSTGGGSVTRYTLHFETNGGSRIDSVLKIRNTTVNLSKYITEREGFSFDGWYTEKELENKVSSIKMKSSITLYAKWVEGDNGYESNPNYKPDIFAPEHNAYIVGREGGYIAPNENLTRAEAATMFFRLLDGQVLIEGMTKQNGFSDVNEGDWFNTAVSTLTNLGVLNGRTLDTFAPDALITRAEFMTIVARLSEAKYEGEDLFVDIAGHWAKDYINIAASIKWANGYGVIFKPDSNITRAEAFTIVNRSTNRLPENISDLLDGMETFVDNSDVNAWYYINIQEATNSHDFEIKADGIHEKWTSLKENPSWEEIEG